MNNEPVAWMREDGVIAFHKQKEVDSQGYKWQSLYTHPAKTLTEIIEKNKPEIEKANAYIKSLEDEIAILRKAQEK